MYRPKGEMKFIAERWKANSKAFMAGTQLILAIRERLTGKACQLL